MKMRLPVVAFMSLLCLLPGLVTAGSWYVAVNGLNTNPGTFTSPWPLGYALTRPSNIVLPGDTIWIRGGTYMGPFTSNISGSAVAPVWVRNFPHERPVLMGNAVAITDEVILTINGQFSYFMGLEVTTNATTRISTGNVDPPPDIYTATGVYIYGESVKLINCNIHDCQRGGIGFWKQALNAEVYGCMVFNNGYTNTSRGHGPGIYAQNNDETKPKSVVNSFIFNGFSLGIQFFTTSSDVLRGFTIDSSTVFNSGANTAANQQRRMNFLAGGSSVRVRNLTVTNSVFYRDTTDNSQTSIIPYSSLRKNVELGTESEAVWDVNVNFNNNLLYGDPTPLLWHRWDTGSFRNNFIYAYKSNNTLNALLLEQPFAAAPITNWNFNTYRTNQPSNTSPFNNDKNFATWKSTYAVDSNSTYNNTHPDSNHYFVRQNRFEPHKYYVTVQNYTGNDTVALPLNNASLNGTSYAIFDVQNSIKAPVDTGNFGGETIPLKMNRTAVAPLTGTSPVVPKHSSKTLGTFIIEFYPPYTTVKNGNWADPTVWSGGKVPQYFNKVILAHSVTVTTKAWCHSIALNGGHFTIAGGFLGVMKIN
ncbi:MAG: hypothetical protein V4722_11570 [Bacteroidota bacterium]